MKDVDDEIHVVQQDPTSLGQSFHMMGLETGGRECRHEMFRHPPHMGVRRSRHDHEIVGGRAQAAQVQYYRIYRLAIDQRVNNL